MTEGKLTARQQRFAEEFVKDANATQAAIRAGFSAGSAKVTGCRLLTHANVAREIDRLRVPVVAAVGLTLEGHLRDLERLRNKAEELGQLSAAINAEVSRGKVVGYYGERYSAEEIAKMTDEELVALAERAKLGHSALRLLVS